ncbi:MAG: T9SS type A sorting domain-containing protein, partial [Bacteroidales bacterium]|nr:T9SS type A sorting domain-containing protein [Bacteroidales bacterium]
VNNKYAVHFEDYAPQNLSYFKNCSFKNNEYFIPNEIPWFDITEKAYPYYFVELYKVNYIRFLGCEFKNETGNDRPFGNGIYSYNSNFVVDGVCNNTSNPCTDWDPGLFKKLQYAIYVNNSISTKTFSVQSCNFIHNHRGIYASHISDVKILSNNFQIKPLQGAFGFIYGIYLNQNCFDFHIENNYFYSSTYERSSTGLYIRNASIYPNWVHNNTFGHLQYGSVADGINRNHYTETGLCYKCNNFDDCEYDIRVVGNAGEEGEGEKNNDGIAEIQGAFIPNVPCDTCPAGNLFTDDDNILIDNFENNIQNLEIMYIHHENISIFPLVPTPGEGVTPVTYEFVDYDPASSCPSWINTSNPHKGAGEKIAEMEDEKFKADSVQTVLNLLVDGGNTENLAQEVNTSMPQDALEVRNELMGESPYLSDSVMKAAIYKENVLPNVMIRDVLVANPQAAKSEEVMGAIDERYNTMPEYMKYEILQGQDIFGAKEMKEMEIGRYQTGYNNLFQSLLNTYRHDTVNQWPADSIVNLLNRVNTRGSKYLLIVHYLEQHQYTEAVQTLQQVGMQFEQTEREEEENADFETLIGILTSIHTGNIALDELDTSMVNTLMDLYERDYYMPGGMARNLLIQGGYIDYHEPFNDGGGLKSSMVKPVDYSKKPENMDVRLNVFPNPGKDYIIVEHEVIIPFELLEIKIYDLHGREIISFHSNKDIDQQVVDFTNYPAGSYLATILINRKQVKSKKFNIVK